MIRRLSGASLFALMALSSQAAALEPINREAHINHVLLQGFIGDAIVDNCPAMRARKFRAFEELYRLRSYALDKGYQAEEIRAFVTDKSEKARGKAEAAAWLKERGAEPGKTDAYCRIGHEEIGKGSLVGSLLRASE